jgi:ubiquinone biosynthesis protein
VEITKNFTVWNSYSPNHRITFPSTFDPTMSNAPTILSGKRRARKIYWTAFRIMRGYVSNYYLGKVFGKSYYAKRQTKLHLKNATRLQTLILELRGLLVKVGQLISGLSNILPPEYADVLESLQDHAPASDFADIRATLRAELGDEPEMIFELFSETPMASASIGQVHRATLKDGTEVAVKVHHSHIAEIAKLDLRIIERLIGIIGKIFTIKGLDHIYGQVCQMIEEELDYKHEAEVMQIIASNLENNPSIAIPKVHEEYCGTAVLTTAFMPGIKISDTAQLDAWGIDREQIAKNLIHAFGSMILEDGFYHADPHPGNLLVQENGTIVLLDFGAVARLSEAMKGGIPVLAFAVFRKDTPAAVKALRQMGFIGPGKEANDLAEHLIETITEFFENEIEIKNMNLTDLSFEDIKGSSLDKLRQELGIKKLTESIQIPEDWILLERTIVLLIGTCSTLAPEVSVLDEIKPQIKKIIFKNGLIKDTIIDAVKTQLTTLISLPSELSNFLQNANKGNLEVTIKGNKEATLLRHWQNQQLISTALLLVLGLLAYHQHGLQLEDQTTLQYLLAGSIIPFLIFVRASWKARKTVRALR